MELNLRNQNRLRVYPNQKGELLIMPPVGGNSGNREADLIADVTIWNRQCNSGKVFSSSTIFVLSRIWTLLSDKIKIMTNKSYTNSWE